MHDVGTRRKRENEDAALHIFALLIDPNSSSGQCFSYLEVYDVLRNQRI